jgi:hypothetical protein
MLITADVKNALRLPNRQVLKAHLVHEAERHRVQTDANCEREHGHRSKSRTLDQETRYKKTAVPAMITNVVLPPLNV